MIEEVVEMVHSSSPGRLTALVNALAGRGVPPEFTESLFRSLASGHESAFDPLTRIPDDSQRTSALRGLMSSRTLGNALDAVARLRPADRDAVLPALAEAHAPGMDTAARMHRLVDYMDKSVSSGAVRDELLREIIKNWSNEDPRGAAGLIDEVPELAANPAVVAEIASNWELYRGAPEDAANWASRRLRRKSSVEPEHSRSLILRGLCAAPRSVFKRNALLACAIAGALAGWLAASWFTPRARPGNPRPVEAAAAGAVTNTNEEILAKADAILAESSPFLRRVQLMDLVREARPGALRRLLEKFPHDSLARRVIAPATGRTLSSRRCWRSIPNAASP